jgi:hypothetical protein
MTIMLAPLKKPQGKTADTKQDEE